ncbi:hypothetical protein SLEP1_g41086 [Rubroshorea leprosula]|uniref:Uncharacterized protein n=1 Tax=Rubroshorea leprosula TaxID=152421 RepID=A0AAV5L5D9_9ROSI|nr:hypothetical protein SLEP1_g41086 [Rubroshorea leprosula]
MVYDLNTLKAVTEIGHYEIYGADIDSAIPTTKVGVNSGEVFYANFRILGGGDNDGGGNSSDIWVCLGDGRKIFNGKKEGSGCKTNPTRAWIRYEPNSWVRDEPSKG